MWIASYPKSGNTWLRALVAAYYYSEDGIFNFSLLPKIYQFPSKQFFTGYKKDFSNFADTAEFWLDAQEKINSDGRFRLFKTHNAFLDVNNFRFTNTRNTMGCIYLIRDPRNVITSLSHYYQISLDEAYKFMTDDKRAIVEKVGQRYLGFQALFSWKTNVKSWVENKKFPVLVIKYEDLIDDTYLTFKKVIDFINKISNLENTFNKEKGKNSVKNTNFNILQKLESNYGFKEALISVKTKKKIKFFNLGEKNDFKKILPQDIKAKLDFEFKKELKNFNYTR